MRYMVDSITATDCPAGYPLYLGYDDGNWPDAAEIAARNPGAVVLRATVFARDDIGDVLDIENGDAIPEQAPGWIERRRADGHGGPLLYCSESAWSSVMGQIAYAGLVQPGYIIAGYPGSAGPKGFYPAPSVGHQYVDVGPYDASVMVDYLPGIDPAPAPIIPTIEGNPIMPLPTGCTDHEAVNCFIREEWNRYHTDPMTVADQQILLYCYTLPVAQKGFGGSSNLLLASIVDSATAGKKLRPALAGSV